MTIWSHGRNATVSLSLMIQMDCYFCFLFLYLFVGSTAVTMNLSEICVWLVLALSRFRVIISPEQVFFWCLASYRLTFSHISGRTYREMNKTLNQLMEKIARSMELAFYLEMATLCLRNGHHRKGLLTKSFHPFRITIRTATDRTCNKRILCFLTGIAQGNYAKKMKRKMM